MHSNAGDSVSVDAFKKTKSGRSRGPPVGRGHGGRGGARGGYRCDPKVDIVNSPLTDEVNVPIVEHPTNPGNAQPMVKPAITVVRVVIMPDTAVQHTAHPLQEDITP